HRTSERLGALLNATFGNVAELIISIAALRAGLHDVVKASLTGSIIGNVLLVFGASALAGGIRYKHQQFNRQGAQMRATMLTLSAIALVVPAAFHQLAGREPAAIDQHLSLGIAAILLITYGLALVFTLYTHSHMFSGGEETVKPGQLWSLRKAIGVLAGITVLIAWISEILVGSIEVAAQSLGMTNVFVGVVIVAIIGNAAEHATAIRASLDNRMELSLGISLGSSLQIALFVAPVLVFLSYLVAPRPMDLVFSPPEVLAVAVAVVISGQIASDGESNWLEGVQLLAVYAVLAMVFYFLPGAGH
ncbi:MAG: calcium/proton exchanger, partial [Acidobacteria bacterium]|nr:calcium/proton exchanger [Acidobacteriota bacterium]